MKRKTDIFTRILAVVFSLSILLSGFTSEAAMGRTFEKSSGVSKAITAKGLYDNWDGVTNVAQFKGPDGNLWFAVDSTDKVTVYKTAADMSVSGTVDLVKMHSSFGTALSDDEGNFYLVTGQANSGSNTDTETIFISKYDSNGNHIATTGDNGSSSLAWYYNSTFYTKTPFEAGCCDAAISGGVLAVNYSRTMYSGHQSNSVFAVDIDTMEKVDPGIFYQSHSFAQRSIATGSGFAFAGEGDCYDRTFDIYTLNMSGKQYSSYKESNIFHFYLDGSQCTNMYVVNNNFAHMGGLAALSDGRIVFAAQSAKSMTSAAANEKEDIFIQIFDPSKDLSSADAYTTTGVRSGTSGDVGGTYSATDYGVQWLTSFSGSASAKNVQIAVTDDDHIVILYEDYDGSSYKGIKFILLDADGNVVQDSTSVSASAKLNPCEMPVYTGGRVCWVGNKSGDNTIYLYALDPLAVPVDISLCTVSEIPDQVYSGSAITPAVDISYKDTALVKGSDYSLAYSNNTNAGTASVTISGKDFFQGSRAVNFNILPKDMDGVTIAAIPDQKYTGSEITPKLTVKDGSRTLKADTDYSVSFSDNIEVGTANVTITGIGNYKGSRTVNFTIKEREVTSISVKAPDKVDYFEGDELDLTGGKVIIKYDNNTSDETELTIDMVSGYDPQKAGSQTLTVSCLGKTATFTVKVTALASAELLIDTLPKSEYFLGDEIDLSAGILAVTYNSGRSEKVPMTDSRVSVKGFNSKKTGSVSVTITFLGKSVNFDALIIVDPDREYIVDSISIKAPAKLNYYEGDELDLTGGSVNVSFEGGLLTVIDMTMDMISGYDNTLPGRQSVTVTYGGKTAVFNVNITALKAVKLVIDVMPATSYYLNEELNLNGGTLLATYNNGNEASIPMTDSRVSVSGFDSTTTGTKKVSLSFKGKSVYFDVTVSVDPLNAPVLVNGTGYETLSQALKASSGDINVTINHSIAEKNIQIPKTVSSAVITSQEGVVLTLNSAVINTPCDITLDLAVAAKDENTKVLTLKTTAAEKKVTINRLDTAMQLSLTGNATTEYVLDTAKDTLVSNAANVKVTVCEGTRIKLDGAKFRPSRLDGSGKLEVYNASTVTIGELVNADITLNEYQKTATVKALQKLSAASVKKMTLTVKDTEGGLLNISGRSVMTLTKAGNIEGLEDIITIVNTDGAKRLSAVQYNKDIRAEYLDALTLSDGNTEVNYSTMEKAAEAMKDASGRYTLRLNEDVDISRLYLPKLVAGLTIDGNGHVLKLTGIRSINPKYAFGLKDINLTAVTKTGVPAALNIQDLNGDVSIEGLGFNGTTLNITGAKAYTLTLGDTPVIAVLKGFGKVNMRGNSAISKSFNANDVVLESTAELRLMDGSQMLVNKKGCLSGNEGSRLILENGFKPIDLRGGADGRIKLISDISLEDKQIFKTKTDITEVFDVYGISPATDGSYEYGLYASGAYYYLKAPVIELNGTGYAFWNEMIAAINDKTAEAYITLLADVDTGGAFKLPAAAKCAGLTINGNGHVLSFTGNSASLNVATTFKDITIKALKRNTAQNCAWVLRTNGKLTKSGNVNLIDCTEK